MGRDLARAHQAHRSRGGSRSSRFPSRASAFPPNAACGGSTSPATSIASWRTIRWSGARLETQFLQVSEAGEITNLEGLTQGIGLDLRPFLAGTRCISARPARDDFSGKPGLDLFYSITPSLKLTGTFNTDFGETEVDARQINLVALLAAVSREAVVLPGGRGRLQLRQHGSGHAGGIPAGGSRRVSVLQPPDRPAGGRGGADRRGRQADGHRSAGADVGVLDVRTGDLRGRGRSEEPRRRPASSGICSSSPTWASSSPAAIRPPDSPARPTASTCGWRRPASSGESRNLVVDRLRREERQRRPVRQGLVLRLLGPLSQRQVRRAGRVARDPGELRSRARLRPARQRPTAPAGGSYNPRPKDFLNIQQMFHDVFYTRFTRLDNGQVESWDLYVTLLDWHFKSGDNVHGLLDFNPTTSGCSSRSRSRLAWSCRRASTGSRASGATCSAPPRSAGSRGASGWPGATTGRGRPSRCRAGSPTSCPPGSRSA